MVSKLYFEETFSLATAQALQELANNNLIVQGLGDYGMKISYLGVGEMFAETEITGLTIGNEYSLSTETVEVASNVYRTKVNALPNDNTSMVAQLGYGTGKRTLLFTATAETMYIAIGDETGGPSVYSIVDNVSLKIDGVEAVTNGTFELGNTTGWYAQNGNATLTAYDYVVEPPVTSDNPYLEAVSIPLYDTGNPAHCLIPTDAPWNATTLNNATWRNFFLEAGDYTGRPNITTSGTASQPRTITLYDNNDTHPAQLASGSQARVAIEFIGVDYWQVSRLSGNPSIVHKDWGDVGLFKISRGCSNIILDRLNFDHCWSPVGIERDCYNNTIQKSYFNGFASGMELLDASFIQLQDGTTAGALEQTLNTKVVLNDFRNYKAMRLQNKAGNIDGKDFSGTIFDSNASWYDDETRVDIDGNLDINGDWCNVESGVSGIKSGAEDATNPVIYSNNTLQGAKPTYPSAPSGLSSPNGPFTVVYFSSKNVHQFGNVIVDTAGGPTMTSNTGSLETFDSRVEKNISYQCGGIATQDVRQTRPIRMETTSGCTTRDNVVKDAVGQWASLYSLNTNNNYFGNNDVINSDFTIDGSLYDSVDGLATNVDMTTAEGNIKYTEDYTITTHRYTASPQTTIVPNVLEVPQSDFIASIWAM